MPLFDAALTVSTDCRPRGRQERGFLKIKCGVCEGGKGEVSILLFWVGASGFQDMSRDNGLGKGPACSQAQEGQSDHEPLKLASDVYCVRWERVSIKLRAIS